MSAKHIAAVKDAEKKSKSSGGGGGGGAKGQGGGQKCGNNNNAKGRQQKSQDTAMEEQDPPEVTEALMSFRKVEKIVKENPSMAATVLWKITKGISADCDWFFCQSALLKGGSNPVTLFYSCSVVVIQAESGNGKGACSPDQHPYRTTGGSTISTRIAFANTDRDDAVSISTLNGQVNRIPLSESCPSILSGCYSRAVADRPQRLSRPM